MSQLSAMAAFIRRHSYRFTIDMRSGVVSVAIEEFDSTTGQWFKAWHDARTLGQLREILGY